MADAKAIISSIMDDLNREYSEYQDLHCSYLKKDDEEVRLIHRHLIDLCKLILKKLDG